MSDTPRTDAAITGPHTALTLENKLHSLCASMERELARVTAALAAVERARGGVNAAGQTPAANKEG